MRPTRGPVWLVSALGAVLTLAAPAALRAAPPADASPRPVAQTTTKKATANNGARKRPTKKAITKRRASSTSRLAHQRPAAAPRAINDVKIVAFPSEATATAKALAENRRDQLNDAEKAARAPSEDDRWHTVLFDLRNLDARADAEGCFWRLIAYYRLGEVARARTIRELCDLAPREQALIESEDTDAADRQPMRALAEIETSGPTEPVANLAPYAGAGPTHLER